MPGSKGSTAELLEEWALDTDLGFNHLTGCVTLGRWVTLSEQQMTHLCVLDQLLAFMREKVKLILMRQSKASEWWEITEYLLNKK